MEYHINLILTTFDKEKILVNLFGFDDLKMKAFDSISDYDVLVSSIDITNYICQGLSFFSKKDVIFDENELVFLIEDIQFISKDNYKEVSTLIQKLNGIEETSTDNIKFRNAKAKEIYEQLNKAKQKQNKSNKDSLDIKDILSILCHADGNGINIFNVGKLTIYQMYEHFERLNIKESHRRILPVWANGHLKENDKLPEWIVKTKL
ncbi:hypothetical protein EBB07_29520 [Paenibacillaceae bacterium]|nr:hypothetical protein EBB07_29520 [Paenibacillaceae bacterium]